MDLCALECAHEHRAHERLAAPEKECSLALGEVELGRRFAHLLRREPCHLGLELLLSFGRRLDLARERGHAFGEFGWRRLRPPHAFERRFGGRSLGRRVLVHLELRPERRLLPPRARKR